LNKLIKIAILPTIPRVSQWVFYVKKEPGIHLNEDTISKAVKHAFRKLKLPETYTLHTLRHTYASHLALQGVPIQQISLLLGHKNLQTTLIYAHLLPKDCKVDLPY
jgi:integrase